MDKIALKNFDMYSREKLIKDVKNKAKLIGTTEEGVKNSLSQSSADIKMFDIGEIQTYIISGEDIKKYNKLVEELKKKNKNWAIKQHIKS